VTTDSDHVIKMISFILEVPNSSVDEIFSRFRQVFDSKAILESSQRALVRFPDKTGIGVSIDDDNQLIVGASLGCLQYDDYITKFAEDLVKMQRFLEDRLELHKNNISEFLGTPDSHGVVGFGLDMDLGSAYAFVWNVDA
jgi:hypothetical protein